MSRKRITYPVIFLNIALIAAFMFSPQILMAQQIPVPVELSKEKIVVEGKVFYMHKVLKGQTLYSIARAYNVTVDQIRSENMIGDEGLKEGQILKIPAKPPSEYSGNSAKTINGKQTESYPAEIKTPETAEKSRSYSSNPYNQDERYLYHRVLKGETFSSIANEYGISVRDLRKANRGLLFPNEGDYVMIPRNKLAKGADKKWDVPIIDEVLSDTIMNDSVEVVEPPEEFTIPVTRSVISSLNGNVKVAVLFPFFINENNNRTYIDSTRKDSHGKRIYRELTKPGNWIFDGSLPFLEAYEGILVAVDSLRSLGLDIELEVFDTEADTSNIKRLLWNGILSDADLIIGPVFSYNLDMISDWAAARDIPFVSPVPLRDNSIQKNKPTMYRVFPSENTIQERMAEELKLHDESNIVFLYADSAMYDPSTERLWEKIQDVMSTMPADDSLSLIPYYFKGILSKTDAYSGVAAIENILDQGKENIIVLSSTNTPVVSSVFSTLHSLSRKYEIKVIGYPEIRNLETVDLKYFYDLELFVPAESYIDFDAPASLAFSSAFMKKFKTEPMAESFAWRGFDIAWYFIGGLATGGKEFLKDPGIFNPLLLCLDPEFRRDTREDGYENKGMFMLHYCNDMTVNVSRPAHVQNIKEEEEKEEEEIEVQEPSFIMPF